LAFYDCRDNHPTSRFHRASLEPAVLSFNEGLNIIYGASNTGKSFTTKAITFMLGASSKLQKTEQLSNYDASWLGITLPDGKDVTLYRAINGGNFRLHDGLVTSAPIGSGKPLLGTSDAKRTDTLSHFLLESLGLSGKVIVTNASAEKENLAIRHIVPYVLVSEEEIISENDPVHYSRQYTSRTLESNLFRFLLTGKDDAAAVTVLSKKTQAVATKAKIELVDEMIAQLDEELGEEGPNRAELANQIARLSASLVALEDNLLGAQSELDGLVAERRALMDSQREITARVTELDITLQRFGLLSDVYKSDIARLEALEEGGYVLMAMAGRDCPICGAPPSAQRHKHATEEIERAHRAAAAEIRKIRIEQRDLRQTITSLEAEAQGLRGRSKRLTEQVQNTEALIGAARPKEVSARADYEALAAKSQELDRIEELFERRDRLMVRRSQIEEPPVKAGTDKPAVGIDGTIAFTFGQTVAHVLEQWHFPKASDAKFDIEASDITVSGKARAANGKGVRAILHAAFNVSLLIYCREHDLPHPGFVVLDTPLLTYREPLTSRHGELAPDEAELSNSPLSVHFYEHLAGLKDLAQIIVVENSDPPDQIRALAHIETFTGRADVGRYGLFPAV
jgi:peptidoglycan hydrolase CwlO-like protein